jgi:hypothetical protein
MPFSPLVMLPNILGSSYSLVRPARCRVNNLLPRRLISDIPNHVAINAQLASLTLGPGFKRVTQMAVERAVREVSLVYSPIYSVNEIS